ncbi:MAG: enoyl-CoA hydratase-related protein [Desulfatiglans sp.]|jgi:enoyl-CoA hydratase/carnithine racemase|nr:enoyl-CoA hydratase-related protein [Thermodesulfobacteriota bacterium]MEE4351994.1 enoyl-CoA hydratase-related protein [Desulfatiglans sp.]
MDIQLETVIYDVKDMVATITINRPDNKNSLTIQLMKDLCTALEEAENDPAVGVVVLTATGDRFFCPGLDLTWAKDLFHNTNDVWAMNSQYARIIYDMRYNGKPVIARINGITAGGGCEFLIAADLAIAADTARFQQGEGAVGAVASYATQSLTPIMGDRKTRWFLFTDEVIDAKTALEYGLVNRVVPFEELDKEVEKLCKTLLKKAPWSLRFTKDQINVWFDSVSHTLRQGNDFWSLQSTSPETLEGIDAFINKRPPQHVALRQKSASGKSHTFLWGPPTVTCPNCHARWLPEEFEFCGKCGSKLA